MATNRREEINALNKDYDFIEDDNFSTSEYSLSFSIDKIVIREDNSFMLIWKFFDLLSCTISGYVYAWLAAFGDEKSGEVMTDLSIFFECCYLLTVLLKFITEYTPEGERVPVR